MRARRDIYPRDIVKALHKLGFLVVNKKGSHFRLCHTDGRRVTVAVHPRPLSLGTLHSILQQAEITREALDGML